MIWYVSAAVAAIILFLIFLIFLNNLIVDIVLGTSMLSSFEHDCDNHVASHVLVDTYSVLRHNTVLFIKYTGNIGQQRQRKDMVLGWLE